MEDKNERNGRLRREVMATSYYWPDGDGIDMCPEPLSAAIGNVVRGWINNSITSPIAAAKDQHVYYILYDVWIYVHTYIV